MSSQPSGSLAPLLMIAMLCATVITITYLITN